MIYILFIFVLGLIQARVSRADCTHVLFRPIQVSQITWVEEPERYFLVAVLLPSSINQLEGTFILNIVDTHPMYFWFDSSSGYS